MNNNALSIPNFIWKIADLLRGTYKPEKYGMEFSESERLAVEQIKNNLTANESLKIKAKNNSLQNFKYAFEKEFDNGVINEYSKNQDFYGKILKDEEFKEKLMGLMMIEVYNSFKNVNEKK